MHKFQLQSDLVVKMINDVQSFAVNIVKLKDERFLARQQALELGTILYGRRNSNDFVMSEPFFRVWIDASFIHYNHNVHLCFSTGKPRGFVLLSKGSRDRHRRRTPVAYIPVIASYILKLNSFLFSEYSKWHLQIWLKVLSSIWKLLLQKPLREMPVNTQHDSLKGE